MQYICQTWHIHITTIIFASEEITWYRFETHVYLCCRTSSELCSLYKRSTQLLHFTLNRFKKFLWSCLRHLILIQNRSYRSYMLSPDGLSVCLSVVGNGRAPYSGGWNFRKYFYGIWYLGHPLTCTENLMEIVPGNSSVEEVKPKRGTKIYRFWTYRRLYLGNGARYDVS